MLKNILILMMFLTIFSCASASDKYQVILQECLWFSPMTMDEESKQYFRDNQDAVPDGVIDFLKKVAMNNRHYATQCESN